MLSRLLITSPIRLDGVTLGGNVLQYSGRRVAEMEMGCSGGIHYEGRQLHLEIVVAISTCHLLQCKRHRSYFEGDGYHPDMFLCSQLHIRLPVWFLWKEVLWTTEHGRSIESLVNHGIFRQLPARWRHAARESLMKMQWQLMLLFPLQSPTEARGAPQGLGTSHSKFVQVSLWSRSLAAVAWSLRYKFGYDQAFSPGIQTPSSRQRNPRGSPHTQSGPLSARLSSKVRDQDCSCFQSLGRWSACAFCIDKCISLIVSFCSGPSAWSQTVFFLHSIPLGFLPDFLICPLFPLSSPGYFPRNSSATFFFIFFSSMSRTLLRILWHMLKIHGVYCISPAVYPLARLPQANAKWQL